MELEQDREFEELLELTICLFEKDVDDSDYENAWEHTVARAELYCEWWSIDDPECLFFSKLWGMAGNLSTARASM